MLQGIRYSRLAPHIEKALQRKQWMQPLKDEEIPEIHALGRQIVEQLPEEEQAATYQSASGLAVPIKDPAKR